MSDGSGGGLAAIRRGVVEHRRGLVGAAVLAIVLGVAVLSVRPWSTTSYELQDSGVWLTRSAGGGQIGRLNAQIGDVDYVREAESASGIVQDGRDAYLVTTEGSSTSVAQLDPTDAGADPLAMVALGGEAQVGAGGGVVAAVVDGDLRVVGRGGELGTSGPSVEVGEGALLAVGPDGTVVGWSPSTGRVHVVRPGRSEATRLDVPALQVDEPSRVGLTLVGEQPVLVDATGTGPRLLVPGRGPVGLSVEPGEVLLQLPGPAAGEVVVATDSGLVAVDLADGDQEVVDDTLVGDPVRPAVDDGCTYGAVTSGGTLSVAAHCSGREPVRRAGDATTSTGWRFRTGGPAVVLNDTVEGTSYVVVDDGFARAEWPDDEEEPTEDTEFDLTPPNPRDNEAPVAVADTGGPGRGEGEDGVGARIGRVTYLPLLRNDHDPNGDILAVDPALLDVPPAFADLVEVVPDGRAVAIDLSGPVPQGVASVSFSYRATDGELLSPEAARVEVGLVAADAAGHAPQAIELPPMRHEVVAGSRAGFEVLSAFWDYDGDPLYLEEVSASEEQHRVSWTADGQVTLIADQPDTVALGLTVKDITGRAVEEVPPVTVTVEDPAQPGDPALRNDVVASVVGKEVTVDPLANDLSPTGRPLRLVEGSEVEVLRPAGSAGLGTIDVEDQRRLTFTPQQAGDHVLLYQVESGGDPVEATILVRVAAEAAPPVVRPDVVVVEETRSDEVDLLGNDVDPGGGLLSVTQLAPPEGTAPDGLAELMSVSVQDDYRTLRVDLRSAARSGGRPLTFTYTVQNADAPEAATSTATVVVVPFRENRPPEVREARASVRAGGVATVPLAAFASDPDRDPLEVAVPTQPDVGEARPSGDSIRFFAPTDAVDQEVVVDVVVTEPAGNPQSARLTLVVAGPDSPPRAPDLEGRVRAGGTVTVALPLARTDPATGAIGLDPDGDAVRLLGRSGTEELDGSVTIDQGRQAFVFDLDDDAGRSLQTFTYRVVDATGRESGDGTVRVLVTEPTANRPPVAMVDRASARAGREIFVDPVANDTDLDGDPLVLSERLGREGVDDPVLVEPPEGCEAETTGDGLVRITPDADARPEDRCTVAYAVVDTAEGAGEGDASSLPQEGVIVVTVRPGFTGVRPLARDDQVLRDDASGGGAVTVDVRANDEDRDGDPGALAVALVDGSGTEVGSLPGVTLDPRSGRLAAELGEEVRTVRYRITDVDGLEADAVVRLPAADENAPPELVQDEPITVTAGGERVEVALSSLVRDPDGPSDRVTFTGTPAADGLDSGPLQQGLARGRLVLEADPEAVGRVQVPVEATDVEGAMAVVEVEVTIEGAENTPPEWAGDPCGAVEAGVTRRIPLRASDRDTADNDDLRFDVTGGTGDVRASVDGRSLVVAVDGGAAVDRTAELTLTVADGNPGGTSSQPCVLRIVPSRQPPLRVSETGTTVEQGGRVEIDVAQHVANAIGGLRVEGTPSVVPATAGRAAGGGRTVTFVAAEDAPSGQAVVTYRVSHERKVRGATREQATGRIVVQVLGRPDRPTGVSARPLGDEPGSVEVRWSPGDANGSPITGYEVAVAPGGTRQCRSTPCTITGLTADGTSTPSFTVTARNAVGASDPSEPFRLSEPLDQPPEAPTVRGEALGAGEGSARRVRFTISGRSDGSRIVAFEEVTTPVGRLVASDLATRVYDVPGGPGGGSPVCLSVRAVNSSGTDSPDSDLACVTDAYGRPGVEGVVVDPVDEGSLTARVSWTEVGNGRPVTSREIGGADCSASAVTAGSAIVRCSSRGPKTITVSVTTAGGTASASASGTFFQEPSITDVAIAGGYRAATVTVLVDDGGAAVDRGRFLLSDGTTGSLTIEGSGTARGTTGRDLAPWEAVTVVEAVVCRGAVCSDGRGSGARSATPFGDAPTPTLTVSPRAGDGSVTAAFTCTRRGSGRTYDYRFSVDGVEVGVPQTLVGCEGSRSFPVDELGADGGTISVRISDSGSVEAVPGVATEDYDGSTTPNPPCAPAGDAGCVPCPAPPGVPCDPGTGGGAPAPRLGPVGPVPDLPRRSPR